MKKTFLLILCISALHLVAQTSRSLNPTGDSVIHIDSRNPKYNSVPGEILIRYKDDVVAGNLKVSGVVQTGIASVDMIFQKYKINQSTRLFPHETRQTAKVMLKAFNGREFEKPSLHNTWKLTLPPDLNLFQAIEELKLDPNVIYAEPNYIVSLTDMATLMPTPPSASPTSSPAPLVPPNDPLYPQQGYISEIGANAVWDSVNGKDSTQVIAILDSGIDWMHPDLAPNIWINTGEIPGNGIDDDGNGYVDDVRGWDWINSDNNPYDDSGHGTHVAGIAAARGNNGIGIAGVSPRAKIMPVKVFDNKGTGDAATITQGINYAASMGATILNMSFSLYTRSFTMENALLNAYLTCDLVASAGNISRSIYPLEETDFPTAYPAALSYVIGIQANAAFSNYDPDGPIYSEFEERFNYELMAPGTGLLSTFRNGAYKQMSGTSMSAPCVSGAISLYKSFFPQKTREDLWADFIYSSTGVINVQQAMFNSVKYPVFDLMESHVVDTLPGDDRDGQADAGETIQIWVKVRNTFAFADSAYVKLQPNIYEDTNDFHIVIDSAYLGSMGTFSSLTNQWLPFRVFIKSTASNNTNVTIDVLMKNKGDDSTFVRPLNFKVYNGQELSGVLTQDLVLTPDKLWLINNSFRIGTGITLTVMPGTHVQINAGVDNRGHVHAEGTSDSLVYLEGNFGGDCFIKYADINLKGGWLISAGTIENTYAYNGTNISVNGLVNCKLKNFDFTYPHQNGYIQNCYVQDFIMSNGGRFDNISSCVFDNYIIMNSGGYVKSRYSVFTKIINVYKWVYPGWPAVWYENPASLFGAIDNSSENRLWKNTMLTNDVATTFVQTTGGDDIVTFTHQYWGTTDSAKIKPKYLDFWNNAGLPFLNYKPLMTAPSDSCPGHVWRVLINGHDAQDEVPEPIGTGNVHFAVCFNKAMDTTVMPTVSFGLRLPYTQHLVTDSAHWSADHKTWYAVFNVKLYTGDGINRIRVADAKAPGDFTIPTEDQRFNLTIQAAGTASANFMALPGIGKVYLEWNNSDIVDLLGFNLYRFYNLTDTTYSQPVMINAALITDTTYTDFAVTPGQHYWYFYRVVNTDLRESDSSNMVSAIPYSAALGDVNGDGFVNVLDVTAIIAYMLGQNPQPFLYDAADVNNDNTINILDVIGIVNIISGKKKGSTTENPPAYIYLDHGTVLFKTSQPVAGLQFELEGPGIEKVQLQLKMAGFELATSLKAGKLSGILYSFTNKPFNTGLQEIIGIAGETDQLRWGRLVAGDVFGTPVRVIPDEIHSYSLEDCNLSVFPNPFVCSANIHYKLYEPAKVEILANDIYGRTAAIIFSGSLPAGDYTRVWNSCADGKQQSGVYLIRLTATGASGKIVRKFAKVVMIK